MNTTFTLSPFHPFTLSQFDRRRRPRQACPEGHHDDPVTGPATTGADRLVEGDADARRGGVAIFVDVDEDLVLGEAHLFRGGIDDSLVDLMRDDQFDGFSGEVAGFHGRTKRLGHLVDGKLVDFAAIHLEIMHALGDGLGCARME